MKLGPGFIVAAAFIGPGTVTTCTLAGAAYGMTLLWVLLGATAATVVLQEMSARLGLVTREGLTDAFSHLSPPWGRGLAWVAGGAAVIGVIAFQAGNLTGAGLGLAAVTGTDAAVWTGAVAVLAGVLLVAGRYVLLERLLMACVALMGVVFLVTAVSLAPRFNELVAGLLLPRIPDGAALTALALVGTTLVPYNLFLHASTVQARWPTADDLPAARRDLLLAVGVGGLVSASIVVTAASVLAGSAVDSATDMAAQLEPVLGRWARLAFGLGFATAGLTSAITAPLAAAYIVSGLLGSAADLRAPLARVVVVGCVAIGAFLALAGIQPLRLIVFAQAANGLILPVIALALVIAMNDKRRLGRYANRWLGNVTGVAIVGLCCLLAFRLAG